MTVQSPVLSVIEEVRERTDTVLLAFSNGKDSIGAWLALREHFRVIPFYQYYVPGLEFIERSLRYYEQFFGVPEMVQVPHRKFWLWLDEHAFHGPESAAAAAAVDECDIPDYRVYDIAQWLREDLDIPDAYLAISLRSADNLSRLVQIRQRGAVNHNLKTFFPIHDWKDAQLADEIARDGVKLPVDYRIFARSFEGLRNEFLAPIKEHFPSDYERIKAWFPWVEMELMRHTMYG